WPMLTVAAAALLGWLTPSPLASARAARAAAAGRASRRLRGAVDGLLLAAPEMRSSWSTVLAPFLWPRPVGRSGRRIARAAEEPLKRSAGDGGSLDRRCERRPE